jgi:hypothetical protein
MRHPIILAVAIVLLSLLVTSCDAMGELGINWHGLLGQSVSFGILFILLLV